MLDRPSHDSRQALESRQPGLLQGWRDGWRAVEAELAPSSPPGAPAAVGGSAAARLALPLIFLLAFAAFALHAPQGLPNGDAAVYAQQAIGRDFTSRPVHLGYFLLAAPLGFFGAVPDQAFNLLSSFFAALAVMVVYALARLYLRDGLLALAAPLALVGNALFLENAAHAEIYAAQTFFLAAALFFHLRGRPLLAGLFFGVAALVTPAAVFFAPFFLLARRPRLAALAQLGAVAALVVLVPILPMIGDYLHGDRGLLAAAGGGLGPLEIAVKEGFEVGIGFLAFLPLAALGIWRAARRPELRPFLGGLAATWALTAALGEKFSDVPAQLPTFTLASLLVAFGAVGLAELLSRQLAAKTFSRAGASLALACFAATLPVAALLLLRSRAASLQPIGPGEIFMGLLALLMAFTMGMRRLGIGQVRAAVLLLLLAAFFAGGSVASRVVAAKNLKIDGYRGEALALGAAAAPDFLAIGSWERGILLEHYLFRRSYTERVLNTAWLVGGWGAERQEAARDQLAAAIAQGRQIWLLGNAPEVERQLAAGGYQLSASGEAATVRRADRGHAPATAPTAMPVATEVTP